MIKAEAFLFKNLLNCAPTNAQTEALFCAYKVGVLAAWIYIRDTIRLHFLHHWLWLSGAEGSAEQNWWNRWLLISKYLLHCDGQLSFKNISNLCLMHYFLMLVSEIFQVFLFSVTKFSSCSLKCYACWQAGETFNKLIYKWFVSSVLCVAHHQLDMVTKAGEISSASPVSKLLYGTSVWRVFMWHHWMQKLQHLVVSTKQPALAIVHQVLLKGQRAHVQLTAGSERIQLKKRNIKWHFSSGWKTFTNQPHTFFLS